MKLAELFIGILLGSLVGALIHGNDGQALALTVLLCVMLIGILIVRNRSWLR